MSLVSCLVFIHQEYICRYRVQFSLVQMPTRAVVHCLSLLYVLLQFELLIMGALLLLQVNCLLNEQELHDEIAHLRHLPPHPISHSVYNPRRSSLEANLFFQSTSLSLLLDWCRAIGRIYGIPVSHWGAPHMHVMQIPMCTETCIITISMNFHHTCCSVML